MENSEDLSLVLYPFIRSWLDYSLWFDIEVGKAQVMRARKDEDQKYRSTKPEQPIHDFVSRCILPLQCVFVASRP